MKKKIFAILLFFTLTSFATEVSFLFCYDPNRPEEPTTRRIIELAKSDTNISPHAWGGLTLPGAGGRSTFMLAIAGGSAPDIYKAWFHILRHDIENGFVSPLDEWISPDELPQDLWGKVATIDNCVCALPEPKVAYYGIIYRKDIVAAAGLDPEAPPKTWSDFRAWCIKLTKPGRRAFAIENRPWGFLPWVQSANGEVISKKDGQHIASFDCDGAVKAAEFIQDLVNINVVRALPTLSVTDEISQLFVSGEIVAVFGGDDLIRRLTDSFDLPSDSIGLMPFPAADENGTRVLQAHRHFYVMSESAMHRPKHERDDIWKCLKALTSRDLADEDIKRAVAEGRSSWCHPSDLLRLGFKREHDAMPKSIREMYEDLDKNKIRAVTEPWVGFWQGASDLIQRRLLGVLLSDAGKNLDCKSALESITADANRGLMFDADTSSIDAARPYARVILGAIVFCALISLALIMRERKKNKKIYEEKTPFRIAPWIFLAPAALSILLWSYYPLFRGAIMAFQNYHIVGETTFAGLDNFIRVALDPNFYRAWVRTFEYVLITLLLGFLTPIFLAVMLCEIPRGRIIYRFFYFLPHLTSAIVITLLWKLMFDPTENGILNQILASVGIARQSWLLDPSQAMICCIVPGVWASAGISSLIYIAALTSLPKDYYEAAALDGAGFFARFRHITFPQLAPLMVINFVGAFIAAFQGMGSIFLLTFGGPGDATQVLSLQIWKEAYNNLHFSSATTMAWFLGVALISFTVLQIRFLRRVEFRQASAN